MGVNNNRVKFTNYIGVWEVQDDSPRAFIKIYNITLWIMTIIIIMQIFKILKFFFFSFVPYVGAIYFSLAPTIKKKNFTRENLTLFSIETFYQIYELIILSFHFSKIFIILYWHNTNIIVPNTNKIMANTILQKIYRTL